MKKAKKSIIERIKFVHIVVFVMFLILGVIGPISTSYFYVKSNNNDFYNSLLNEELDKHQIIENAFLLGFNIESESNNSLSIYFNDNTCNVDKIINQGVSTRITFKEGCPSLTISLGTKSLTKFVKSYVIYCFISLLIIEVALFTFFRVNRKQIENTVININETVNKIKNFGDQPNLAKEENTFVEFNEILEIVLDSSEVLKTHIKDKTVLIQTLNHELKTPINKVNSIIQAYEIKMEGYTDDVLVLRKIEDELKNMMSIIDYSLHIFTLDNDEFVDVSIKQVIKIAIEERYENIKLKKLKFAISESGNDTVFVDKAKFSLVMSNLIENCSKYALDKSTVNIKIRNSYILIENEVDTNVVSGTQKGLKLATQILSTMKLDLSYELKENVFQVKIKY